MTPNAATASAARPWWRKKRFIIPAVLVGVLVAAGIAGSGDKEQGGPYVPSAAGAYRVCEKFVRQELRSPSSATFPAFEDRFVTHDTAGFWAVRATVEADNVFGAHLRSEYICHVRPTETSTWTLDGVLIDEPTLSRSR